MAFLGVRPVGNSVGRLLEKGPAIVVMVSGTIVEKGVVVLVLVLTGCLVLSTVESLDDAEVDLRPVDADVSSESLS